MFTQKPLDLTVSCPCCDGTGRVVGSVGGFHAPVESLVDCARCNGAGDLEVFFEYEERWPALLAAETVTDAEREAFLDAADVVAFVCENGESFPLTYSYNESDVMLRHAFLNDAGGDALLVWRGTDGAARARGTVEEYFTPLAPRDDLAHLAHAAEVELLEERAGRPGLASTRPQPMHTDSKQTA